MFNLVTRLYVVVDDLIYIEVQLKQLNMSITEGSSKMIAYQLRGNIQKHFHERRNNIVTVTS